ncbi:MAG TPA: DUF992 domain-containing protein [Caulobacteraceae bacterium]|jgi:hypothetical protein|nr:DUF992 domain-containing protein [Caulobacteraceae bacterium]
MKHSHRLLLALTAAASLGFAAQAHAEGGVKAGVLTCNVSSGWGLIFGSSKDLNCTFSPDSKRVDNYEGKISKFGVDIGYQKGGVMVWAVLAPTADLAPGALAGNYGGVTAGATAGVGANANVLVGGSNKTITLQPLSIEGATGLNIAAGVGSITLVHKP